MKAHDRCWLFFLFLSLFVAASRLSAVDVQAANLSPCALSSAETAALSGDASTDIHAVAGYKKTIYLLLQTGRFEQLDCLAHSARSRKELFPGGAWKLGTIYAALEKPPVHPTPKDWKIHIGLLKQWQSAKPHSITPRVALAETYVNYAWEARGHGYVNTVSETGWKLFNERAAEARKILQQASSLPEKCPEWYVAMQDVALAQGWDPASKQALLEQAVKFEPDYFYCYRRYAVSILPQWDGEEGQLESFLQSTADRIGGSAGDVLYFQVASLVVCCIDQPMKFSWPRIQRGFHALERQYGQAPENWNKLARMAAIYGDPVVANEMLAKVGDQWSDEIWHTFSYFQSVQHWAKQVVPMLNAKSPPEESADASLQTVEGQRYKVVFDDKIRGLLQACKQESSGGLGESRLLFRIGKDGMVEQVVTVGDSRLGPCLLQKVGELNGHNRPAFPPPPTAGYWVRVDPNL